MPPLDEGALMYMPTTLPGISIGQAQQLLQATDRIIHQFRKWIGAWQSRARGNRHDPAPLSMLETVITLKPRSAWRHTDTWYSLGSEWARRVFRHITPDTISTDELVSQMNRALKIPASLTPGPCPSAAHRYADHRHSHARRPQDRGRDLQRIQEIGASAESLLGKVPAPAPCWPSAPPTAISSISTGTANGWRAMDQRRRSAERGRERHRRRQRQHGGGRARALRVNVRFQRDFRSDLGTLGRIPVPAGGQRQLPLSDLAQISLTTGLP